MSSDSESDRELVNITHRLGATRTPFITACCVELIFCALMTSWMSDNEHYTVFFRVHEAKIGGAWWGKSYEMTISEWEFIGKKHQFLHQSQLFIGVPNIT
jgi:hypothetical protein